MIRYGTFSQDKVHGTRVGVEDILTGRQFNTDCLKTAEIIAALLNAPSDCRFNCRASRMKDFEAGWRAAQEWQEAVDKYGDAADRRYGLAHRFKAHVNEG